MLKATRQDALLRQLESAGSISAAEAAEHLGVSEDTVRRDLRELEAAGTLQRVHGGAIPRPAPPASYAQRARAAQPGKDSIAQRAAALACDGQLLFLDGGSTALNVARSLSPALHATVVTNAPAVAALLIDHPGVTVYLAGGELNKDLGVTLGSDTTRFLGSFRADISFIGVCALDPDAGLTIPSPQELATKRLMISQSTLVVALADARKLGHAFPYVVAPADAVTDLVTDSEAPKTQLAAYRRLGINIHQ
ncbi:DeoR/GlpR family DNA-binding transcription regulator [Salinisphaera hydrothermalis]|uniref:DeoR/GlpR family DNA-binding transcription regulator n=1 Tax=Salinisphaera hydrothermalis TaxID=563188 RepID=UPI003341CE6E